jgi:hypothetical protein
LVQKSLGSRPNQTTNIKNMPQCKHCRGYVPSLAKTHICKKAGVLRIEEDGSFLGEATDEELLNQEVMEDPFETESTKPSKRKKKNTNI